MKKTLSILFSLIAALFICVSFSGCGDDEYEEFEKEVDKAAAEFEKEVDKAAAELEKEIDSL